jgi:acyl-CoA reductase-like NAD-dependent aldehyde dehydrogenase
MAVEIQDGLRTYAQHYINGEWADAENSETLDAVNPSTEEVVARIPQGTADEANRAVVAAKAAFDSWSLTPLSERTEWLRKIHAKMAERQDEITKVISEEVGMPVKMCAMVQAGGPVAEIAAFADIADNYVWEEKIGNSVVVKEPIGVVACITPWNFPLNQIVAKFAPALAAGCTVILKPTEVAPTAAMILAEVIHDVGLPKGVFNLVNGTGPVVGEALASHPDVDMVSFTGSTRAGKRVSELASQTIKRVALELGGKSPNIILDDADFEKAVKAGVGYAYFNSGQTCCAHTRMLVPKEKQDEAIAIAKKAAERFSVGDPFDEGSRLGPLVSGVQHERVRTLIKKGQEEGATLVTGGAEQPENQPTGYFIKPTVFANVSNDMTIAQEEIFGPVLSIIPFEDEEDAVRIANDTIYGLAGGVWSQDEERAKRVARRVRAGQVDINGGPFNVQAPFGGYKQSGNGREHGTYGLEEFLQPKAMQF